MAAENGTLQTETEEDKAETLRLLHREVRELSEKLEKQHLELMGALNEKDALRNLLEVAAIDATKWRAVEAMALALSEKGKERR